MSRVTTPSECPAQPKGRTAQNKDTAQRCCAAGMPTPSKKKKKKKPSGKGAGKGRDDDEPKVKRDPIFGLLPRPSASVQPKVEPRDTILVDKAYIDTFNGRYKFSVRTPTGCVSCRLPLLHCRRWSLPSRHLATSNPCHADPVCVLRGKQTVNRTGRKVAPGLRSTFTGHRTGRSSGSFAAASLRTSRYAAPTLKAMTCALARATGAGRKIPSGSHTP